MAAKTLILAVFVFSALSQTFGARKYWYRNDNPLLQQHVLIPYTFNKATDQLEYNKEQYGPTSQAWLNNRNYLRQIADEFTNIAWEQIIQSAMLKNSKEVLQEQAKSLPGTPVQATIQSQLLLQQAGVSSARLSSPTNSFQLPEDKEAPELS